MQANAVVVVVVIVVFCCRVYLSVNISKVYGGDVYNSGLCQKMWRDGEILLRRFTESDEDNISYETETLRGGHLTDGFMSDADEEETVGRQDERAASR